jgi:hypothetical protein
MPDRTYRRRGLFLLVALTMMVALLALPGCGPEPEAESLPVAEDDHYRDAWITRWTEQKLAADEELAPYLIHVQTREAVVYLQGVLPSEHLRVRAGDLARDEDYVLAVRNNIQVAGTMPPR